MTASEHRTRAREALRNNWGWAILTSLVASLLGGISSSGAGFNCGCCGRSPRWAFWECCCLSGHRFSC